MNEYSNQKLTGYNNYKGLKYVMLHLKKYRFLRSTFISPNLGVLQKLQIYVDFLGCVIRYGAGINDYFQYNFYKRPTSERKNFIVGRKWIHIIKACNGQIRQELFDDKSRFNEIYFDYLGRDWIDIERCSYTQFTSFTDRHKKFIYKMKNGSGGNGIGLFEVNPSTNLKESYIFFFF